MGRKNKVKKESRFEDKKEKKDEEYEDYKDNEDKMIDIQTEEDYLTKSIIFDIQRAMIDYTEQLSIPLCEYLTVENLENFVLNLSNRRN